MGKAFPEQNSRDVVPQKEQIPIRRDEDIVEHVKEGGGGYQSHINEVLRACVASKRREGGRRVREIDPRRSSKSRDWTLAAGQRPCKKGFDLDLTAGENH